jgi:amino acid adenylation domain-containing protein
MNPGTMEQSGEPLKRGIPLSIAQERLWVLDQLHPRNSVQNRACGLRFAALDDPKELEGALNAVLRRHEILRTEFHAVDGVPVQVVLPPAPATLNTVDLRQLAAQEREIRLLQLAQQESVDPFDLTRAPLLRAVLYRLTDTEHVFLLVVHGIVCDETSIRLLLSEIDSRRRSRGSQSPQPESETVLQYREIGARDVASETQLSYFRQRLKGAPSTIDLPTDRQRPSVQTFRGAKQRMWIEPPLLERLRILAEGSGADIFATLLTAFNVLLFRYSRQNDVVVGTRVSGRRRPELDNVIGRFENTVALRTDLSDNPSFADLLLRVNKVTREALSHEELPFETLLKHLRLEPDMSRHPVFQIMFTMQDEVAAARFPATPGVRLFEVDIPTEQFDLSVELATEKSGLKATFSYSLDLFDASTIQRMMEHFKILLESAVEPALKIARMPLISDAERHQLLVEWNEIDVDYPPVECVHQLFEVQAERTPNNIALSYNDQSLTYQELNQRANRLAHHLRKLKVGPDTRVGICLERGFDMIIALMAVLKAGGAYVPLDPASPSERLQFMLKDSAPAVLLTQEDLRELFPGIEERVPVLDMAAARSWELEPDTNPDLASVGVSPEHVAYVIYTSGSTGVPKGVMVEHANVARLFSATDAWFRFDANDVWTLFHSYAFDFSVWEIWGALFYGGRVVIVPKDVARSPDDFYELVCREKATVLNQTPSAFRQLISAQAKSKASHRLRYVVFGGEALETAMLRPWYEQKQNQKTLLINMYGITETTVHVTYRPLTPADTDRRGGSPVGRRIPDLRTYILDDERQPVPIGVLGELYVGGAGVARGYLNRPELTAERFLQDPFVGNAGERMYKAGDLGRWLGKGDIEFLGRNDSQVKIRGFRIELGEIEARLAEGTGVREGVVIVREDTPGDRRLVAYYTSSQKEVSAEGLRVHLSARLPEYMVPAAYVRLESLPLTTNGKLDRKALPPPDADAYGVSGYEPPAGEIEDTLAKIWAQMLKVERVGRHDNFFALGGHSLLAGRLLSQINEITGRQIPLSAMFRGATVESLAQLVQQETEIGKDPVVLEIQPGSDERLPFFAIVPPGEESLGYAMLARHMGRNQTVYKVQAHAPVVRGRPYTEQEMQAMGQEYAAAIEAAQPEGPYCLGGLCDGTHIAERVILELEVRNREVGLFAIFDTWTLQYSQRPWLWRLYYYQQRLQEIRRLGFSKQFQTFARSVASRIGRLSRKVETRHDWPQAYWPKDFVPQRFGAPVALFRRPKQPFYYVKDREMGWAARSEGGVEIHEIPFDHEQLLREPHVRTLGEELAACIERVSQRTPIRPQYRESSSETTPVAPGGEAS